jgi:hypothetical protein
VNRYIEMYSYKYIDSYILIYSYIEVYRYIEMYSYRETCVLYAVKKSLCAQCTAGLSWEQSWFAWWPPMQRDGVPVPGGLPVTGPPIFRAVPSTPSFHT